MPGLDREAPRYAGDDGSADPRVTAALAAYASGQGGEHAALAALTGSRLLVPIVAGPGPARRAKTSEMALPTLVGNDGRHAVLAFTGMEALTRWRPDARPVPVPASRVWQAAAGEASAVVVDVAGPVPLPVEGARLTALARGLPAPPPHEDPDLVNAARTAAAAEAAAARVRLLPGEQGGDLTVEVAFTGRGRAGHRAVLQRIGAAVMTASGGRLRRGITVTVVAR